MKLDDKGRCPNCLRKPLPYRREHHFFCHTCCRQYRMSDGEQQPNWAWEWVGELWRPTYPDDGDHTYIHAKPTAAALRR